LAWFPLCLETGAAHLHVTGGPHQLDELGAQAEFVLAAGALSQRQVIIPAESFVAAQLLAIGGDPAGGLRRP